MTRNGTRPRDLNAPAALYIETHGGTSVGGSDDHAGIDIGPTFTEAPAARSPAEFLAHLRAGHVWPRGEQGSVPKWAHGALVLAARAITARSDGSHTGGPPDPSAILRLVESLIHEREPHRDAARCGFGPEDVRHLLCGWPA